MKKLLTVCAACLVAGMAAARVESQIVGYQTKTADTTLTIMGVNFQAVGGGEIAIVDLIDKDTPGLTAGLGSADSDNIQVYDTTASTFVTYFLGNGLNNKGQADPTKDGWIKGGEGSVTTDTLAVGQGFWYVAQNPSSGIDLTTSGEVVMTATGSQTIAAGLNLIANPFPVDLPLNDADSDLRKGVAGLGSADSDNIQVYDTDAEGFVTYFLGNGLNNKGQADPTKDGWVKGGESSVTTDSLPAGSGAWYVSQGSGFTWEPVRPF
jgi:hypothetical protein